MQRHLSTARVKQGLRFLLTACPLLFSAGCSRTAEEDYEEIPPISGRAMPTFTQNTDYEDVHKHVAKLPDHLRYQLGDGFYFALDRFVEERTVAKQKLLPIQYAKERNSLPVIPEFIAPFKYVSKYDKTELTYLVKAPQKPDHSSAVVILLGDQTEHQEILEQSYRNSWYVYIPSRTGMNYQLLAEGDFWGMMQRLGRNFPQLESLPTFIVGTGSASQASLVLANNYRWRFAGLAFAGDPIKQKLTNLDHLPVVYFGSSASSSDIWGGRGFVSRLQERGNTSALHLPGDLSQALQFLQKEAAKANTMAPFAFTDNQYRQAFRWLEVISRKSELEPVTIRGSIQGDELVLEGSNVASVLIDRAPHLGFPQHIRKVRLNDELYTHMHDQRLIRVGESHIADNWKRKPQTPATLLNFFRNEQLIITYQDTASEDYVILAKKLAEQLAGLQFSGLPASLQVELPILPMSEYQPEALPKHRLIAIGQPEAISSILGQDAGYHPLQHHMDGWRLNGRRIDLTARSMDDLTYALTYPPESSSKLKLALLLVAPDELGLQTLTRDMKPATALYRPIDFRAWTRSKNGYQLAFERVFDSYWGDSNQKSLALTLPPQSRKVWASYMEDLLINQAGVDAVILSSLVHHRYTPPSEINHQSLSRFVHDQDFAIVTTLGSTTAPLMNKILDATQDAMMRGTEDLTFAEQGQLRFDRKLMRKKKRRILVPAASLKALTMEERKTLDAQLVAFSLEEMLLQKITAGPIEFGRELLRTASHIEQVALLEE